MRDPALDPMRDPLLTRTRDQIAADNRAEIDGWIDERTTELIATGVDPADARRRALDEFGDVAEALAGRRSRGRARRRRSRE